MKEKAQSFQAIAPMAAERSRPWPPLWVFALAIVLGGLGALLSPFLHVHWKGQHAYVHQHAFLGSHSHPQGPDGPSTPESSEKGGRGSVALAAALSLEVFVPSAITTCPLDLQAAVGQPQWPAPSLLRQAPWAPRGPPVHRC